MTTWKTPTPQEVKETLSQLSHFQHRRYFFENLENPEWLVILDNEKVFKTPPEDRAWPEGEYLARVAGIAPDAVLKIITPLQSKANALIHEQFIDAVIKMPVSYAEKFVQAEILWIKSRPNLFGLISDKYASLVTKLAEGGVCRAAIGLTDAVLSITPRVPAESESRWSSVDSVKGKLEDSWSYGEFIKKITSSFAKNCGESAIKLFSNLLLAGVRAARTLGDDGEDASYVWRPSLDDSHTKDDVPNVLVTGLREMLRTCVAEKRATPPELIKLLGQYRPKIFKRLALDLVTSNPTPELVGELVGRADFYTDVALQQEFWRLARLHHSIAPKERLEILLHWIQAGPDIEKYKQRDKRWSGKEPSAKEIDDYAGRWKRDRLAVFSDVLPQELTDQLNKLKQDFGEPASMERPLFQFETSWGKQISPLDKGQIAALSVTDLVKKIREFIPSTDNSKPSPEGFGLTMREDIAENPARYASSAKLFIGLDPTYIRHLIYGLQAALKKGKPFEWVEPLELLQWVANEEPSSLKREGGDDRWDSSWHATKTETARLLENGFTADHDGLSVAARKAAWSILEKLFNDSDPNAEQELQLAGEDTDFSTAAINNTRGVVLHAVVQYSLWVRRSKETGDKAELKAWTAQGFKTLPEVESLLDKALADMSPSVHSVFGRWFPWLGLLDPEWTKKRTPSIFLSDPEYQIYRDAAWDSYITFCPAYDDPFELLRPEYLARIANLGKETRKPTAGPANDESLAQHIMQLYWRGRLSLTPIDPLFDQFWKAPTAIRQQAIKHVGFTLHKSEDPVPETIIKRLTDLLDWRIQELAGKVVGEAQELKQVGWWLISKKFPPEWILKNLNKALDLTQGAIEADSLVLEALTEYGKVFPVLVSAIIFKLVTGDKKGWLVAGSRDRFKTILSDLVKSGNAEAETKARELIDLLGRKGFMEFGDL